MFCPANTLTLVLLVLFTDKLLIVKLSVTAVPVSVNVNAFARAPALPAALIPKLAVSVPAGPVMLDAAAVKAPVAASVMVLMVESTVAKVKAPLMAVDKDNTSMPLTPLTVVKAAAEA